ncbi:MAG: hypothetical protein K6F82_05525 [Sphaerochaetaceae bacterium]|nr:hypothetical protein [Sphaerochaetaceae bacterium]
MKKLTIVLSVALLIILALSSCSSTSSSAPTVVGGWKLTGEDYSETVWFTDRGKYVCEYNEGDYVDIDVDDYEYRYEVAEDGTVLSQDLYIDGYLVRDFVLDGNTLLMNDYTYKRFTRSAKDNSAKIKGTWSGDYFNMGFISNGTFIFGGGYRYCGDYVIEDGELELDDYYDLDYVIVNNTLYLEDDFYFSNSDYLKFERNSSAGSNTASLSYIISNGPWSYVPDDGSYTYVYAFKSNGTYYAERYNLISGAKTGSYSGNYTHENIYLYLTGDLYETLTLANVDGKLFGYAY